MEGYVMKLKQPEITILWGNDKVKKTYVFENETQKAFFMKGVDEAEGCLLYTSPSPRDGLLSRMPSSA